MSQLRFSIPLVQGRGAGLGNELIVWCKAYLGAQITGATLLHPAWGLNKREYWRYFGTSRLDFLGQAALRKVLPTYEFTEADYRSVGEPSMEVAIEAFVDRHKLKDRSGYIIGFKGLWGGFDSLSNARSFAQAALLNTRFTQSNLFKLERRLQGAKIRVGVHIRRGDFGTPADLGDIRGKFNQAVPLEWYKNICRMLVDKLGASVVFVVVSDASPDELRPITQEFNCVTTHEDTNTDISDLLALSMCDFVVCSISSFSVWSVFLSEGQYGWFEPNLVEKDGFLSIWGAEPAQILDQSETSRSRNAVRVNRESGRISRPRGVAIGLDGEVPETVIDNLRRIAELRDGASDLIRYGVVERQIGM